MSITATVENDTIKLPPGVHLPDGTEVTIEPREKSRVLEKAAEAYQALLAKHPKEAAWVASWEGAPAGRSAPPETPPGMKRGTVVWVNLSDAHPPEMGKVRPAVVLVPLSTQPGEIWPLRVKVAAGGKKPSFAIVPGLRQAAKSRLLDTIGLLPAADLAKLEHGVGEYLSEGGLRAP